MPGFRADFRQWSRIMVCHAGMRKIRASNTVVAPRVLPVWHRVRFQLSSCTYVVVHICTPVSADTGLLSESWRRPFYLSTCPSPSAAMSTPDISSVRESQALTCEVGIAEASQEAVFHEDDRRPPTGPAAARSTTEITNDKKHQSEPETMDPAPDALPEAAVTETIVVGSATPASPLDRKALVCLLVQHFSR